MLKLPFRYALSAMYTKLLVEDLVQIMHTFASAGWYNLIFLLDPAVSFYRNKALRHKSQQKREQAAHYFMREIHADDETSRIVKEVCVDLQAGEIKVLLWNRMNAGYVFRRIYLPAEWKEWLSEKELKAIIGHEVGHLKIGSDALVPLRLVNRMGDHLLFQMLPIHITGAFLIFMATVTENWAFLQLASATILFRSFHLIIENTFSRKDEYAVDQYGVKATNASTMKQALKKIHLRAKEELIQQIPSLPPLLQSYYIWLFKKESGKFRELLYDHPFLEKRLQALQNS
jgi:hypothetical protein